MKSTSGVRRYFLDEEISRLARGKKTVSGFPAKETLKDAIKAAGIPQGTPVEFSIVVTGTPTVKATQDVQLLECMWLLKDPR